MHYSPNTSIIKAKLLKMSKFKSHTHTTATPISHGDNPPVPHSYSRYATWAMRWNSRSNVSSKKMSSWSLWCNPVRLYTVYHRHICLLWKGLFNLIPNANVIAVSKQYCWNPDLLWFRFTTIITRGNYLGTEIVKIFVYSVLWNS